MVIVRQPTKAARKAAREPLGDLMSLLLTPARARRNRKAAQLFLDWAVQARFEIDGSEKNLQAALVRFILEWWQEGESKEVVSSLLQSFKYLMPSEPLNLSLQWRLYRRWGAKELPAQAPPSTTLEALAIAGQAFRDGHWGLGVMLLLAFDGYLRTGEFCAALPEDFDFVDQSFVLHLGETKGVARRGGVENYPCEDARLTKLAKRACQLAQSGVPLIGRSQQAFRGWFGKALRALQLQARDLKPYSLRRGGITAAVRAGVPVSTVVQRARWRTPKVADVYIREGDALLAKLKHTPDVLSALKAAASCVPC